jgi:ligand-binding SRPBCC domain-containing protein
LRKFYHTFTVNAGINRVWEFYTDIGHLEVITPPEMQLEIVRSTTGHKLAEGTEVWLTGVLVIRSNWHSKITSLKPYVYVDEMLSARFKVWKHVHAFRKIDEKTTEVIDEIDFELPYGFLGRMFEGYAYRQLEQIFEHRKQATIKALV